MTTISFQFNSNLASVNAKLANMAMKQIPFAASKALNQTGKELLKFNKVQMRRNFSNPVPYTVNAFRLARSTKKNLVAEIKRKDRSGSSNRPASKSNYLETQSTGGVRKRKGIESKFKAQVREIQNMQTLLPTSRTSVRGQNISKARAETALSGLKSGSSAYPRYFYSEGGKGKNSTGGIYRVNSKRGKPQKMFHTKPNLPTYSKGLPFNTYMMRQAKLSFPKNMRREMRAALRTAKFR